MSYVVDFVTVSTTGLESSPVAEALAGLRANEARYYKNKYDHVFTTHPAADVPDLVDYVARVLQDERPPFGAQGAVAAGQAWSVRELAHQQRVAL